MVVSPVVAVELFTVVLDVVIISRDGGEEVVEGVDGRDRVRGRRVYEKGATQIEATDGQRWGWRCGGLKGNGGAPWSRRR
jgi:hypothetical protein